MGSIWFQFLIIVLLMMLNGFFAASEIAVVSARRGRLQQRAEAGTRGARDALTLAEEPNRFLATVQIGITLVGTVAAAFGGDVLEEPIAQVLQNLLGLQATTAQPIAFGLVVLLITYLSLIIGELVPKRMALQHAESVATFAAPIMRQISRVTAPIVWFLTFSTQAVLTLLRQNSVSEEQVTEEDVMSLVREGAEGGTLEASERDLIQRVFEFTDVSVRSIMTPRTEIVAVSVDDSFEEIAARVVDSGYSRVPVFRDSLDTMVGVIYAKDLLAAARREPPPPIEELMRAPVYVLEHQRLATVLQQMQQTRTHLALVLDEYGQVDGLITLEDVLERLTGEIDDEYDEADQTIVRRADGSWLVDGLISYADAEHQLDLPPRTELEHLPSFDTLAGLLLALFERIPSPGETVTLAGWTFEVVDMDGMRIDKVLVHRDAQPTEQQRNEASLAFSAATTISTAPRRSSDDSEPTQNGQA